MGFPKYIQFLRKINKNISYNLLRNIFHPDKFFKDNDFFRS